MNKLEQSVRKNKRRIMPLVKTSIFLFAIVYALGLGVRGYNDFSTYNGRKHWIRKNERKTEFRKKMFE